MVVASVVKTAVKLFLKSLLSNGNIRGSFIQSFPRSLIELRNNGVLSLGEKNQARKGLTLICDGGQLSIGSHCQFNVNVSISCIERVTIGDRCSFGNNVVLVDHDHDYAKGEGFVSSAVMIGSRVWIGANVVILKGATIGDDAVIAAGSVVSGVVESGTLYVQKRHGEKIAFNRCLNDR